MTDRPLTLAEAAEHYPFTRGELRAAALRGDLKIYRAGKRLYTTHSDVMEWFQSCRVVPKDRAYISTASEANGKSAMDRITFARAALRQTLNAPKNS